MKRKLYILAGPPCSGKTTWAKKYLFTRYNSTNSIDNIILISCDNIRKILYGNKYKQNKKDETLVWNKFYHLLEKELNNNTNVDIIIDNTNCKYTYYIKIFTLIKDKSQWEVEVIKFNHSLWKLYLRNIIRYIKTGKFIPFKIIKIMKHNYNELDFKLIDKIFKK